MSDEAVITALRRKAGVGRAPPEVQPMSAPKALRLAVARAAEDTIGLIAQVTGVAEDRSAISRLAGQMPESGLLFLLEGPGGATGLAAFDPFAVAAMVEQQTTGDVLKRAPEVREPTATDAMMCTDITQQILELFADCLTEAENPPDVAGYSVSSQLSEARSIGLAFEDVPYRLYRVSLSLGHVAREGEMILVFPYQAPQENAKARESDVWETAFETAVLGSAARLDGVLHRFELPLTAVMELEAGMLLGLPAAALGRVEVLADDRVVACARLGQMNGHRALRLCPAPTDDDEAPALVGSALHADARVPSSIGARGQLDTPDAAWDGAQTAGGEADAMVGLDELPSIGADAPSADANELGELPEIGDLPAMGDLPPLDDFPPMGDLPDIGDFPPMGDLPDIE
ncbi:FliM/FliN family flagellar motor switch protein [Celeribacter arenosi]|uniref:Flagellar motor switch protein FliM n=1 Tax=Celeribacter arenosi TaxID=792649 RepID=A0ABP7KKJ6_9RHOB